MKKTLELVQSELSRAVPASGVQNLKRGLAACLVNRAVCLSCQERAAEN